MSSFVHQIFTNISDLGYIGIVLGLILEVIPSEIVLAYGGYLVSQGKISFVGAVIAGVIGGISAQWIIYWISRYGGRPFLKKYGKYLLIKEHHIDKAEQWFNRYGTGVIFTARFIPVVRHAISIPAGIARMSFIKFTLYTGLAAIPWSILFLFLGQQLGANWGQVNQIAKPYIHWIVIGAVVLTVLYFVFNLVKRKSS
jgi:membrane protein DedA with SNARE-associated domain